MDVTNKLYYTGGRNDAIKFYLIFFSLLETYLGIVRGGVCVRV